MHTYIFEADLHFFFWAHALPWVPPLRAALPTRYQCELSEAEINAYYDLPHPESPTLEQFPLSPTFRFPKKHAFNGACHMNLRDMFTNLRNIFRIRIIRIVTISIHVPSTGEQRLQFPYYFPKQNWKASGQPWTCSPSSGRIVCGNRKFLRTLRTRRSDGPAACADVFLLLPSAAWTYEGFHKWRYPNSWMAYSLIEENLLYMDDLDWFGVSPFLEIPI